MRTRENKKTDDYDCFYGLTSELPTLHSILQPYCLRSDNYDLQETKSINKSQIFATSYTFFQLRQMNVTSKNLYEWSAPMDVIEHYELYNVNSSVQNEIYYNCTSPFWFGRFCQYTLNSLDSFIKVIYERFESRIKPKTYEEYVAIWNVTNGTCYMYLKCNRGPPPMCLDWREICDRKCDCLNDCIDEKECFQLEINECQSGQYRCSNGMCISQEFLLDLNEYADCMDASDEKQNNQDYFSLSCLQNPDFNCDTLTCSWFNYFSCGDGMCVPYSPLTLFTQCANGRDLLHDQAILAYDISSEFSQECWLAIICASGYTSKFSITCKRNRSIQTECPSNFAFPSSLSLFNHFHFIYEQNRSNVLLPDYICYNVSICNIFPSASILINGWTCKLFNETLFYNHESSKLFYLYKHVWAFFKGSCPLPGLALTKHYTCPHSNLFHCEGTSKCISKYHLQDGYDDCYPSYDEVLDETCFLNLSHRFYCPSDEKCIPYFQLVDGKMDCLKGEDESISNRNCLIYKQCENEKIIFSKICDGFTELSPIVIDGQNETDETNCQYWPCNTSYTNCDKLWNCKNGIDELNCLHRMYPYDCKSNEHQCLQLTNITITQQFNSKTKINYTCLPIKYIDDEQVHCLGGTDERSYCRLKYPDEPNRRYRCWNDTKCIDTKYICNCQDDCPFNDDENVCPWVNPNYVACDSQNFICRSSESLNREFLCTNWGCREKEDGLICDLNEWGKPERKYFFIRNDFLQYPSTLMKNNEQPLPSTKSLFDKQITKTANSLWLQWYCNQGLLVYTFNENFYCFCPPAYYGDRCQYQNEFVAFILNIRRQSPRDHLYVFRVIIILLDDKNNRSFREQILYISSCERRYHMYLLYPNRPKLNNRNYSIRLDIYSIHHSQNLIQYRTSFYYPIRFTFLPVNRLVVSLVIPEKQAEEKFCDKLSCQHGKCYQYENSDQYFCRHDHPHHQCNCSHASICTEIGCICPLGKSGSLCYFPEEISCTDIVCQHDGTCIPHDQRILKKDSVCVCTEEYEGQFCEKRRLRIRITFDSMLMPASIFIHYFISRNYRNPDRLTDFKRIFLYENAVVLYTSMQYDMVFVQFDNTYYLVFLNSTPVSIDIDTTVIRSNRCPFIDELLNQRIAQSHPLKRIKYYQLICQENINLRCFYDEFQLCLCTKTHMTNCFDFNYNETSTCFDNSYCQNNGQCYLNNLQCPTKFLCVCERCYHGTLCQFTTSGTVLSLDSIVGYHIRPHIPFVKQPFIIKLQTGITVFLLVVGIISNFFSIITFSRKKILAVGCGIYLLLSSILSILTMILFAYKFWSLLVIQMAWIKNKHFLNINCKMIDFQLRFLPTSIEWLNACVAIERVTNITLSTRFSQQKSVFWAKVISIIIVLINILSAIHDPINRELLEDTEEERIWCIVSYTHLSWLNIYDKIVSTIHFILPFGINFISAFIIIVNTARQRSVLRQNQPYRQHLNQQFQQHKHLLISSLVLVILTFPRLIISFFSGCMKSARNPWLFLSAYLISFIPSILTFPIFVLSSDTYTTEFVSALKHFSTKIRLS